VLSSNSFVSRETLFKPFFVRISLAIILLARKCPDFSKIIENHPVSRETFSRRTKRTYKKVKAWAFATLCFKLYFCLNGIF
jgi:hypothetical protein